MSTITREFSKEQLIARINQVTAVNKYRISRDPDADGLAMDNELLAIALASLEAEPVHEATDWQVDECVARMESEVDMVLVPRGLLGAALGAIRHPKHESGITMGALRHYAYKSKKTAPLAPVVPDLKELEAILDWILLLPCPTPKATHMAKRLKVVMEACRAAMLQGAEPVTTAYKLPVGWVLVPIEPTDEMWQAALDANGVIDSYKAMISAAPQQEIE